MRFILTLVILFISAGISFTQTVDKEEIAQRVNQFDGLELSNAQEAQVIRINEYILESLFAEPGTIESSGNMIKSFVRAQGSSRNLYVEAIGADGYRDYRKRVRQQLKPFEAGVKAANVLFSTLFARQLWR